ncbi:unnamed protein product [Fraxinus pennsylvanica]|uniref:Alpha-ketoglutarate-dependent dioxygenase AlkB-like domain-containing protein n=1 Tax=Fraxinus pennsylvanica TaxID=56036 RepID=A0AAD2E561_9LAMI|nr:unnamed protein product [Fraxinus pennsylvanica]
MGSSPDANSKITPEKLRTENARNQPESCDSSVDLYEKEVSSPAVSINSIYKSKRTKIDLATEHEKRSYESNPKYGKGKKNSSSTKGVNIDEPFDICLSEPLEQDFLEPTIYERNWEKQIDAEWLLEENGQLLRPGMVLLKNYISLNEQVDIVKRCRNLGLGPGGFYRPGFQDGAKLRLYMMCLGRDWNPQTKVYQGRRQHDGAEPPSIPLEFTSLVRRAVDDSHTLIERHSMTKNAEDILPRMSPDVCIVNFYTSTGRLGLHQDRDESKESLLSGLPIVSFSVGDSAEFLYGSQRDVNKAEKVLLQSAPSALVELAKLQPDGHCRFLHFWF